MGLRNLEKAAESWSRALPKPVKLQYEWEPFLLNPNMDDEGEDILEHLTKKYGPSASKRFGNPDSYLMNAGREVGIEFTNKRNIYPTIRAHALMEHVKASDNDKANQLMEEMYKRYFCEGANINDVDKLAEIAGKFGIDSEQVKAVCSDDDLLEQVRQKDIYNKRRGVSGVPFFIFHRNDGSRPIGVSGAQPPEILAEQLEAAAGER